MDTLARADLRDYLAAERTLLAWIRTGLALMGFGFVVARFGVFLRQLVGTRDAVVPSYGLSLLFGTALIVAGVSVNLSSGWHHIRAVQTIDPRHADRRHSTALAVATAFFVALVGLAMAVYLVFLHDEDLHRSVSQERRVTGTHNGVINTPSHHSVDQSVEKLQTILRSKGVALFAVIDHSGEAAKVGMTMLPTKLLIFGSPTAGTPLMLAAPSAAIDLPLKILVWQDAAGKTWISYNSPEYLRQRHGFPTDLLANIAVVEALATRAAESP